MKKYYGTFLSIAMVIVSSHFFCTNLNVAGGSSSTDNGRIFGMVSREDGNNIFF